jgi:elongation factor Ts
LSSALQELGSKIAMHIVAARPVAVTREGVPEEALQSEREILRAQALQSGKPESVVAKMIEGRLRKFYEDVSFQHR